jgi:hypothetical protein
MSKHKFHQGQTLYYKPADFAPLQVTPGGQCTVTRLLEGSEGECEYGIKLAFEPSERIVKESELTTPDQ